MRFEWDVNKDRANRQKHGGGFDTSEQVFSDPLAHFPMDPDQDGEERWWAVGETFAGTLLVVVHVYRYRSGDQVIRIISARKATPHESRAHRGREKEDHC